MKIKVRFLVDQNPENLPNEEVFAYFPEIPFDYSGNKICYAHIGQHSSCCPEYADECIEATQSEYNDLYLELLSIGYDLEVINKPKP